MNKYNSTKYLVISEILCKLLRFLFGTQLKQLVMKQFTNNTHKLISYNGSLQIMNMQSLLNVRSTENKTAYAIKGVWVINEAKIAQ